MINRLFENGLSTLHLRKNDYPIAEVEKLLRSIHSEYHSRIIIHKHFSLLKEYDLAGIYVRPHKNEKIPSYIEKHHLKVSFCHNLDSLLEKDGKYDHLVLGPVFKSISNPQIYYARYTQEELKSFFSSQIFKSKILAIGGINHFTADIAFKIGFDGVVSLGAVWAKYLECNDIDKTIEAFNKIRFTCLQLHN